MKDITLEKCVQFQECFFHDGVFSPFEFVDYKSFYPAAIIGEAGNVLNLFCKTKRSPHSYSEQLRNEGVDVFVYSLLFGRTIEVNTKKEVFGGIEENWEKQPNLLATETDFYKKVADLIGQVSSFLREDGEKYYTGDFFNTLFSAAKDIDFYLSGRPWQESVNDFHKKTVEEFTQINKYTPDLWYNGSCYVSFEKMVGFIEDNQISLPPKRILFLKRMADLQRKQ